MAGFLELQIALKDGGIFWTIIPKMLMLKDKFPKHILVGPINFLKMDKVGEKFREIVIKIQNITN